MNEMDGKRTKVSVSETEGPDGGVAVKVIVTLVIVVGTLVVTLTLPLDALVNVASALFEDAHA